MSPIPTDKPLVLVEWRDSCGPTNKWQSPDMADDYDVAICFTAGWLMRKDDKVVVLAGSMAPDEIGDVTAIPASCVVSVKNLRPARN